MCKEKCEVYSRIVGYYRPIKNWNEGKQEEFKDRVDFSETKSIKSSFNGGIKKWNFIQ